MPMRGLTANAFCASILQPEIDRLGDLAFAPADGSAKSELAQLYSGPAASIRKLVGACAINPVRSVTQAQRMNGQRIDETAIGQFLFNQTPLMFQYFSDAYGAGNDEKIDDAIRQVWAYASKAFVQSGFKHAATAVCGADQAGVFRAKELKVLLNGKKNAIKTINSMPLIHFKRIYRTAGRGNTGFYAAFAEICRTELDVMQKAINLAANPTERKAAEEEYRSRKLFFELEQASHDPAEVALAAMAAHQIMLGKVPTKKRPKMSKAMAAQAVRIKQNSA